jgi:transcriptional regulator with XRE-family HTH domain
MSKYNAQPSVPANEEILADTGDGDVESDPLVQHLLSLAADARPLDEHIDYPAMRLTMAEKDYARRYALQAAYGELLASASVPYDGQWLGAWLAAKRQKQGLTQEEVAAVFDLSAGTWNAIETDPGELLRHGPVLIGDILKVFNLNVPMAVRLFCYRQVLIGYAVDLSVDVVGTTDDPALEVSLTASLVRPEQDGHALEPSVRGIFARVMEYLRPDRPDLLVADCA